MTSKVFALDTQPGIQRDGTVFDKQFYNDGKWVRFQRGRPRKMLGYRQITNQMTGPSRGIWVNSQNNFTSIFSGYNNGLQVLSIDQNGVGSGISDFTLTNFTASDLNLWQFDGFYDVGGLGESVLLAHPGQNLQAIDSTTDTPVLFGSLTGTSLTKIGVFTDSVTTTAFSNSLTLAASNPLIGAGQTITGAGIPANTRVTAASGTTITISNNATASATVTATFDNNVSVSGGVVSLHPYVFVYGNNGLIKNSGAGDSNDWVSTDANEVNVATGKIVQGLPVRGGSNAPSGLFWSLDSLIRVSYIGGTGTPAQYWRYDIISSQSSILSSQSAIEYDGIYYWCGVDRFLMYNGVVKEIPNNMNQNWFYDNLNYDQRQKVWACKVPRYGEIWWFYPRGDATECTDAIIYNTRENTWYDAGQAVGAYRSAGYFSQVFHYPVAASWNVSEEEAVFSASFTTVSGRNTLLLDTYNTQIALRQLITGTNIPANTTVTLISSSGIKTLGAITGGSLYTNGTYTNVALTSAEGVNARATIVVSGGAVTSVTITSVGAGYIVGEVLSATAASIGGTGSGFSVPVAAIYAQVITMSNSASGSGTQSLTFSTPANLISIWQHETGVNSVEGQNQNAIESFFETNDLGLVSGGPSQPSPVGENFWLHLERVEPDFLQEGVMEMYVTGRPFAQGEDKTTGPYLFSPTTGKIDIREQRRELRLKFLSNVVNGDYQVGRIVLNANTGDVRPYGA
jgi:hypothetical protein